MSRPDATRPATSASYGDPAAPAPTGPHGSTILTHEHPLNRVRVQGNDLAAALRDLACWLDAAADALGEAPYVAAVTLTHPGADSDDDSGTSSASYELGLLVYSDEYVDVGIEA